MNLYFHITDDIGFNYRPTPDYSDLKFTILNDKGKGKLSASGNIILYGSDYDNYVYVLGTGYAHRIDIYKGATLFLTINYTSVQVDENNESLKQLKISIKPDTIYTLDAWTNYDKEYNINELAPEANALYFDQGHFPMVYKPETAQFFNVAINIANLTPFALANYDIHYMVCQYSGGWTGIYSVVTVYYKRQIGYGFYIDTVKHDPDGSLYALGSWSYLDDITVDGRAIPRYKRIVTAVYTPSPGAQPYNTITNTAVYYETYDIDYTGVTRKVTDVIDFLFGKMGITVSFDNGGTTTDSFYSFKNLTSSSLTYGGSTTDKYMSNLLIMNLTDFVPAADDGQKDVPASETMVSLKTLLEFFENRGFEWWIEDRSGTDYFVLKHKSHKTLGSGNPNLANYKGRDWNREGVVKYENHEYHKIVNEGSYNTIDFRGTDLVMTRVYGIDNSSSFNDGRCYTDVDDIALKRHEVYPEFENNNIVIIAAQTGLTKDYIRQRTGLLSLVAKNNSELSWSFLGRYLISDLPAANYTVNGAAVVGAAWQLKKRGKITLEIPSTDHLVNDFDFQDYIAYWGVNCELEQVLQGAINNSYQLTIMQ